MEFEIRESLDGAEADAIVVPIREGVEAAVACDARFASTAMPLYAAGDLPRMGRL